MTLETTTSNQLTLFAEASLAKTCQWLDIVKDWLESDPDCSTSSCESLMNSLPIGFSSRTSLAFCRPTGGVNTMRMHEVTADQMLEWLAARYDAGREKYGDAHLHRYGLVDVIEEVLDAMNIFELWDERMEAENIRPSLEDPKAYERLVYQVVDGLTDALFLIRDLDAHIPGRACSDEQGGHRVWWSEEG